MAACDTMISVLKIEYACANLAAISTRLLLAALEIVNILIFNHAGSH